MLISPRLVDFFMFPYLFFLVNQSSNLARNTSTLCSRRLSELMEDEYASLCRLYSYLYGFHFIFICSWKVLVPERVAMQLTTKQIIIKNMCTYYKKA